SGSRTGSPPSDRRPWGAAAGAEEAGSQSCRSAARGDRRADCGRLQGRTARPGGECPARPALRCSDSTAATSEAVPDSLRAPPDGPSHVSSVAGSHVLTRTASNGPTFTATCWGTRERLIIGSGGGGRATLSLELTTQRERGYGAAHAHGAAR